MTGPSLRLSACRRALLLAVFALATAACAVTPAHRNYRARVELLALIQTINADLLSHDSATLTLEHWCADHRLSGNSPEAPAHIVALRLPDAAKPIPDELRERLDAGTEHISYRHVRLTCGEHVLSEADNWYVPARLTAEMNQQLTTTNEPFGKIVKALGFQRRTIAAELLWSPLPHGWEMSDSSSGDPTTAPRIPHDVLRHQAILYTAAQVPFSAVVETYTSALFAFGPWPLD